MKTRARERTEFKTRLLLKREAIFLRVKVENREASKRYFALQKDL